MGLRIISILYLCDIGQATETPSKIGYASRLVRGNLLMSVKCRDEMPLPYLEDRCAPRTNTSLLFLMAGYKIEGPSHFKKHIFGVCGL